MKENDFIQRHIGPTDADIASMLSELDFKSLEDMRNKVVPKQILSDFDFNTLGVGETEADLLNRLKKIMSKNKIFKSYIGMGYSDTITPSVIQRCFFENPVWYTAYTPYQPEISQGRLEALLNFQTMVSDLTGMEISNSSLLDEGTAAAEAIFMAKNISKSDSKKVLLSPKVHPHVLEVIQTRCEPLDLEVIVEEPGNFDSPEDVFAVLFQYPNTEGNAEPPANIARRFSSAGSVVIVSVDLFAVTLLVPPGEWGADIVVGNTQRFGVPMGYGGPHAAFLATKEIHKRLIPGRLVGVSIDSSGKPALRLALQTREQHIRREKATSNICTAQVLLANMASFYGVYHGPNGLRSIAKRIHLLTKTLANGLAFIGYEVSSEPYFDTIIVHTEDASIYHLLAIDNQINFRNFGDKKIGISLDETTTEDDIYLIWKILGGDRFQPKKMSTFFESASIDYPDNLIRKSSFMVHAVFNSYHSEVEFTRYLHRLQNKDLTLTHSMIPLGSCTMKLNSASELTPVSWPEVNKLHPFAPLWQATGYLELIEDLEKKLCQITGFSKVSLQPNSGSQGEYASLLAIRKYHIKNGQPQRNICLIPSSAHGTNPASAALVGMEVVVVACNEKGNIWVDDLSAKAKKYKDRLSCMMLTYPSTHGVYEEEVKTICEIVHTNGGQVYLDGANMNALVGVSRIAELGADACHMNLHKTFAIPHGGGGPGVGPIGVASHLEEFLPRNVMLDESSSKVKSTAVSSAPWGSASILPISWAYISMMGGKGLKKATLVSILSANYMAKKLEEYYPILYKGESGYVAHECIVDVRQFKADTDIDVNDIAKRIMDYGFHPPTMSFPVAGTLMIEPTESEPKAELDRFIDSMIQIRKEIESIKTEGKDKANNVLKNAPHTAQMIASDDWPYPYLRSEAVYPLPWLKENKFWVSVGRVDNAYGDRNLMCSCAPITSYS